MNKNTDTIHKKTHTQTNGTQENKWTNCNETKRQTNLRTKTNFNNFND